MLRRQRRADDDDEAAEWTTAWKLSVMLHREGMRHSERSGDRPVTPLRLAAGLNGSGNRAQRLSASQNRQGTVLKLVSLGMHQVSR